MDVRYVGPLEVITVRVVRADVVSAEYKINGDFYDDLSGEDAGEILKEMVRKCRERARNVAMERAANASPVGLGGAGEFNEGEK
jgi:hypothetical protein